MHMDDNCSCPHMGMMSMSFHFGISDPILISSWVSKNAAEFFLTCVFFFLMATMFEGLKYFRDILGKVAVEKRKKRKCMKANKATIQSKESLSKDETSELSPLVDMAPSSQLASCALYVKSLCLPDLSPTEHVLHLLQTFLHMVQVAAAYALMLVVMTYNLWLFFAVVLGFGVGYLIFGRLRMAQGLLLVEEDPCCS